MIKIIRYDDDRQTDRQINLHSNTHVCELIKLIYTSHAEDRILLQESLNIVLSVAFVVDDSVNVHS